ncbi:helix-turn-helix transcriptional regulator [Caulobacter sp. FWC2]|uniref:ArsR/SmtB family transcription factor n=1 Tax=Caulobacter sp. FWC2 TaxID=69664 RepID=UPI000C148044|nr:metalloregulator ArsR/SmtB family transcription factor [Caulobacter sp. FWC2]PIB92776.1 transcriptional regulator [Caulobacter sp. FWC2]
MSTLIETDAAAGLAALGSPVRLRLFRLLVRAGEAGANVTDLVRLMEAPASTLSHHLAALSRAGLVRQARRGREVICTADYERVNALAAYLTESCCVGLDLGCGVTTAA